MIRPAIYYKGYVIVAGGNFFWVVDRCDRRIPSSDKFLSLSDAISFIDDLYMAKS